MKQEISLKNIYVADFETTHPKNPHYDPEKGVSVYNGFLINIENHKKQYEFFTIEEFINIITKIRPKTIFFHNLSFDVRFIIKYLVYKQKYELVNSLPTKAKQIYITQSGEQRVFKTIIRFPYIDKANNHRQFNCNFGCSYLKTQMSVADLGKFSKYGNKLEINHLEVDYYHPTKEMREYCKRDVLVVCDTLLTIAKQFKNYKSFRKWINSLTLSQSVFEQLMMKVNYKYEKEKFKNRYVADCPLYYLGKLHYIGGFTQYKETIQNEILNFPNQEAIIIDAVSMYPSIMIKKIAYQQLLKVPLEFKENKDYVISYQIRIMKAKVKFDICVLKSFDETRYVYDLKYETEIFVFKNEWELIKEFYDIEYEIVNTYYWKIDYLDELKSLVRKLFINKTFIKNKIKQDPTNLSLKGKYEAIKKEINSIYGKFCQNKDIEAMIYLKEKLKRQDIITIADKEFYITTIMTDKSIVDDYHAYLVKPVEEKEYGRNIIIGAWITSQARIKLLTLIKKYKEDFIYCDTDSLFMKTNKCLKDIKLGEKLGQWELQTKNITEMLITCAKGYEYYYQEDNEIKRIIKKSGVLKSAAYALPKWGMQFKDGKDILIPNAKMRPVNTPTGKMLEYIDITIKNPYNKNKVK